MRPFRKPLVSLMLVLTALGFTPLIPGAGIARADDAPESDCVWSQSEMFGVWTGIWMCSWCNYFYTWQPGQSGWQSTGNDCLPRMTG